MKSVSMNLTFGERMCAFLGKYLGMELLVKFTLPLFG